MIAPRAGVRVARSARILSSLLHPISALLWVDQYDSVLTYAGMIWPSRHASWDGLYLALRARKHGSSSRGRLAADMWFFRSVFLHQCAVSAHRGTSDDSHVCDLSILCPQRVAESGWAVNNAVDVSRAPWKPETDPSVGRRSQSPRSRVARRISPLVHGDFPQYDLR